MLKELIEISGFLPKGAYFRLLALFLLTLLAGCFELGTVASAVPFIGALLNGQVTGNTSVMFVIEKLSSLGIELNGVLAVALIFCFFYGISTAVRVLIIYVSSIFSFALGNNLGKKVFRKALHRSYLESKLHHSSNDIVAITSHVNTVIFSVIFPVISFIASLIILIFTVGALMFILSYKVLYGLLFLACIYVFIMLSTRRLNATYGKAITNESARVFSVLQETLANFRDVKLNQLEKVYEGLFCRHDAKLRDAQSRTLIIQLSPRYLVESIALLLVVMATAYFAAGVTEERSALTLAGVFMIGLQRMLPNAQQAYQSWVSLATGREALSVVIDALKASGEITDSVESSGAIGVDFTAVQFQDVSFRYKPKGQWVLRGVDFEIRAGARVGVIGPSGGGKSTFVDLLSGLLVPVRGAIKIDGIEIDKMRDKWFRTIAYVPQQVRLADLTIKENIAFGIPAHEIDQNRLSQAIEQAFLASVIARTPGGLDATVGEGGCRLSGGERQRIVIARALYKGARLLILDEATSGLDKDSEEAINTALNSLGREMTIIIIAHKPTALALCDTIVSIRDGRLKCGH